MMVTGLLTLACGLIAGLFSHPLGVAPILGALLCGACFLPARRLWIVGLGGMLIRDLWTGLIPFTLVRLAGMALVIGVVQLLQVRPTLRSLLTGLIVTSPVFHLALAVGDWATGTCGIWPRTPSGLWASIVGTIPYFQRSLVTDVAFTALFLCFYAAAGRAAGWQRSPLLAERG